tara:strand:+ start:2710 stop:3234 length:525 start_codon:yes stop_codon:yes gene_type:complete
MASSKKFLKNIKNIKNEHILAIIGFVFLVYALHQYSNNKNIFKLGMNNNDQIKTPSLASNPPIPKKNATSKSSGSVQPSLPTTSTMTGSPINGSNNISSVASKQSSASSLLPSGNNNIDSYVNNVVKPESSPPNRNASLDLRKDPKIPPVNVGPWMISNISRPPDYKSVDITSN